MVTMAQQQKSWLSEWPVWRFVFSFEWCGRLPYRCYIPSKSKISACLEKSVRGVFGTGESVFPQLVLNAGNGWEWGNGMILKVYYGSFSHSLWWVSSWSWLFHLQSPQATQTLPNRAWEISFHQNLAMCRVNRGPNVSYHPTKKGISYDIISNRYLFIGDVKQIP